VHADARGTPLARGAVQNIRSLLALNSLVDMIVTCIAHPAAAYGVFLLSDSEDHSTTAPITRLGFAMWRRRRPMPVPAALLTFCAALLDRCAVAQCVRGSLRADISKARRLLGRTLPVTVDEGSKRAARGS
jgi:hypothetical protein